MCETNGRVLRSVLQHAPHTNTLVSSPLAEEPGQWVDLLSEREAKQLLSVRFCAAIVYPHLRFTLGHSGDLRCVEAGTFTGQ